MIVSSISILVECPHTSWFAKKPSSKSSICILLIQNKLLCDISICCMTVNTRLNDKMPPAELCCLLFYDNRFTACSHVQHICEQIKLKEPQCHTLPATSKKVIFHISSHKQRQTQTWKNPQTVQIWIADIFLKIMNISFI